MKKAVYYRVGQSLPPRHWYQKSVGWFGKAMTGVLIFSLTGAGIYGYVLTQASVKSLSAAVSNPNKLKKVSDTPLEGSAENIIDVQHVLDSWAKKHAGETWSVAVQSIDGPQFSAQLNQDKTYTSASLQKLMMALPLYQQIPVEHQKGIRLQVDGRQLSMQSCVDVMLRLSDQACSDAVAKYLDFGKAAQSLKKISLTKTSFSGTQDVKTTAADVNSYLIALRSDALPRTAQELVLQLLREQTFRDGIPTGCPGCQVANKSASSDAVEHDTALIRYSGGTYALTIMTANGDAAEIGQLAGSIQQKILDTMQE